MNFFKSNWMALTMVLLAIASETLWELFDDTTFKTIETIIEGQRITTIVTWGDITYHFVRKLGYLSLIPSIFLYLKENTKSSRLIYIGLILWNIKEVVDRFFYILNSEGEIFSITENGQGFVFQVIMISLVLLFSSLAFDECRSFFRFLAHLLYPLLQPISFIAERLRKRRALWISRVKLKQAK